jgi:hypothetical protein
VDATTWRLLLPEDRDYSFSGNMDEVEATEVAIARAEAYASDVSRLRTVLSKGNKQQQQVAWQNLVENTREMQESLETARSGLEELSRAAAEGRVDPARLAQSRKKADALAKEIDDALGDVRRNQALGVGGGAGGASGATRSEGEQADADQERRAADFEKDRYSTKEGQAFKRWASNEAAPEGAEQAKQTENARRASRLLVDGTRAGDAGGGKQGGRDDAEAALAAHELFAEKSKLRGRAAQQAEPTAPPSGGPATPGGGGPTTGGGGEGGLRVTIPGAPPAQQPGASTLAVTFAHGTAGERYAGFGGGGGGGGGPAGGAGRGAPGVEGLISLAPPLVEQGRAYSFRKLDASAELDVSPRTQGLGRRLLGAAAFGALLAAVVFVRRRRARSNPR